MLGSRSVEKEEEEEGVVLRRGWTAAAGVCACMSVRTTDKIKGEYQSNMWHNFNSLFDILHTEACNVQNQEKKKKSSEIKFM